MRAIETAQRYLPKTKRGWALSGFVLILLLHVVVIAGLSRVSSGQDPALVNGFRGNVISGLMAGLLFLFLGFALNEDLENLQKETHNLQQETHALTKQRAEREQRQRKIDEFMNFLQSERYHDVRFPELTTSTEPLGLDYTIEPVRDAAGKPKCRVTEMEVAYVVSVRSPSYPELREPENLADYENAPIHTREFYFCRFYDDAWHMGQEFIPWRNWFRFYLSGKVGPVEHGMSANEFMGVTGEPEGAERYCRLVLKKDGTLMKGSGGAYLVEVLRAKDGAFFIQFHEAPPKRLHREKDETGEERLVIDNMDGYFPGPARANFMRVLADELRRVDTFRRTYGG